jgi:hypothetical protein
MLLTGEKHLEKFSRSKSGEQASLMIAAEPSGLSHGVPVRPGLVPTQIQRHISEGDLEK